MSNILKNKFLNNQPLAVTIMQLTYRGISYNRSHQAQQTPKVDCIQKYRLSEDSDSNIIAWVRQLQYYTYRGVSYTKRPLMNATTQLLK